MYERDTTRNWDTFSGRIAREKIPGPNHLNVRAAIEVSRHGLAKCVRFDPEWSGVEP